MAERPPEQLDHAEVITPIRLGRVAGIEDDLYASAYRHPPPDMIAWQLPSVAERLDGDRLIDPARRRWSREHPNQDVPSLRWAE
ncbi:MAG: hypothetical protein AAGG07_05780 [Planctomycetota bacterium]